MSRKIWLSLGKSLPKTTKTAMAAIKKSELSWNVIHKEIKIVGGIKIPDKVAIVREDTGNVLGVVNSSYKSIQNYNVFAFLDKFVQSGNASYYAAGYIGKGEKIWLILKLNDEIVLSNNDIIEKHILFSNAHDGRGAIRAYFLPLRKSSQTLLNIYFGKRVEQGIQMRHIGKIEQRMSEAKNIFDLSEQYYKKFQDNIETIYNSYLTNAKTEMFLESCFQTYSINSTRTQNTLNKIKEFYKQETHAFKNANSAWAWFNSVVDYIDYNRLSKGKDNIDRTSNHLESLFWGSGLLLKQKAWEAISTIIKI
ncbi:MAG: DUF932 domain-containing protein [Candidatus Nanoarchaeia archaeon]|jgi:phage/plasmid-like protein (TIGR03299 family)|nr:DUF932 domain-containing protein [Candidatus Nanoarchaeia archaeon]